MASPGDRTVMDRRSYLALLGSLGATGVVGCLSSDGGATPVDSRTPIRSSTERTVGSSTSETAGSSKSETTGSSTPSRTTGTVPDVSTPPPGECTATSPPLPSTGEGLPDPRPYPERPGEIAPAPVTTFVESYEGAYRFNEILADVAASGHCLNELEATVTGSTVTATANGVVGEVTTRSSYTGGTCPGTAGTDTATPLPHADFFSRTAQYYVTERFLLRDGVVLECWE